MAPTIVNNTISMLAIRNGIRRRRRDSRIALALAIVLAGQLTFTDRAGHVTGSARSDSNGVTTFYGPAGQVTGKARTDRNGVTTTYDAAGRVRSTIRTSALR